MIKRSTDVVVDDLRHICDQAQKELRALAGKRLLITGGAGFLGYYFVKTALWWNRHHCDEDRIAITVIDNFARGVPEWLTNEQQALKCIKHDIAQRLPQDIGNFDYVIHAASIASPTFYRKYPIETIDANVQGLRQLLDRCVIQQERKTPMEGLLFFSTSEIYGDPPAECIPTPESYRGHVSCTGPRACYDESKRFGETLCVNFAHQYDLPIKTVRPFNNYGPGLALNDCRVIADFARCILGDEDLVMHSDGSPTRTFCYVADAIVGYYKALVIGRAGQAYNIGAQDPEISIAELADRMVDVGEELFSYQGRVIRRVSDDKNYLVDNPNRRCPDISKAEAELEFKPRITLDKGLRRSLQWYDAHHRKEAVK